MEFDIPSEAVEGRVSLLEAMEAGEALCEEKRSFSSSDSFMESFSLSPPFVEVGLVFFFEVTDSASLAVSSHLRRMIVNN